MRSPRMTKAICNGCKKRKDTRLGFCYRCTVKAEIAALKRRLGGKTRGR